MTSPQPLEPEDRQEALPPDLQRELERLATRGAPTVPPEMDQRILAAAQAHLAQPRRGLFIRVLPWAAAAAVVLLLAFPLIIDRSTSLPGGGGGGGGSGRQRLAVTEDVLHPVDILPAFALERELSRGQKPDARWDANGDGTVDERDVEELAHRATLLSIVTDGPRAVPEDGRESAPEAEPPSDQTPRFATIAVRIDPHGQPLAAYQFHFSARNAHIKIVGIENGEGPAFGGRPPYYDRKAIDAGQSDRVIVADFNGRPGAELPTGTTRVATLHLMIQGPADPEFQAHLDVAADAEGRHIDATVSLVQGTPP